MTYTSVDEESGVSLPLYGQQIQRMFGQQESSLLNHLPHQSGSYLISCQLYHHTHPYLEGCSKIKLSLPHF